MALSATPIHTERGNSMHTNGIAACIARDTERDRSKATGVSTQDQETYVLSSPDMHTNTPIPPVQQHNQPANKPCGRVR